MQSSNPSREALLLAISQNKLRIKELSRCVTYSRRLDLNASDDTGSGGYFFAVEGSREWDLLMVAIMEIGVSLTHEQARLYKALRSLDSPGDVDVPVTVNV